MSNEKTSELVRMVVGQVARGDLIPIVDVSSSMSPTGETKAINVDNLVQYIVSGGFVQWTMPQQSFQTSNGLSFDETITPGANDYVYGNMAPIGTTYSIMTRAFIPSTFTTSSNERVLFGVGSSSSSLVGGIDNAYISVQGYNLQAYADGLPGPIVYTNFFSTYQDKVFEAVLTVSGGTAKFYVNGAYVGTAVGASTIGNTTVAMGNGTAAQKNLKCTIYDAAVYSAELTATQVTQLFYGGTNAITANLISLYSPRNLNPGPSQWLDSVGTNHLLLGLTGSRASNPGKTFSLRFKSNGSSGYLGNGTQRDVLPDNYVLTDAFMYSSGSALLSIGSSPTVAPYGAVGVYSYNNNRVALTNAVYSRNNLDLLDLGVAHKDKTLYVFYSSSNAPCTYSFEGYISEYGPVTYNAPAPVITSSLAVSTASGSAFSYDICATNYPVYYSASKVPAGLSLNPATGKISGTPTVTASLYLVNLFASNVYLTGSAVLALTVVPAPTPTPSPTTTPAPSATPVPTSTPVPTATPTAATPTPTPTPSGMTPAPTPSPTPTPTPTTGLYSLSVNSGPNVAGVVGSGTYSPGSHIFVSSSYSPGYAFANWSNDVAYLDYGQYVNANYITMPSANIVITAVAQPAPSATPTPTPAPSASPTPTPSPTPSPTPAPLCYTYGLKTDGTGNSAASWTDCATGLPASDSTFGDTPNFEWRTVCSQTYPTATAGFINPYYTTCT